MKYNIDHRCWRNTESLALSFQIHQNCLTNWWEYLDAVLASLNFSRLSATKLLCVSDTCQWKHSLYARTPTIAHKISPNFPTSKMRLSQNSIYSRVFLLLLFLHTSAATPSINMEHPPFNKYIFRNTKLLRICNLS